MITISISNVLRIAGMVMGYRDYLALPSNKSLVDEEGVTIFNVVQI